MSCVINSSKNLGIRLLLGLVFLTKPLLGIPSSVNEDTLKAVYTYHFGKFTDWPANRTAARNAHFNLCILGTNPFGRGALESIEGKPVKARPLHTEIFDSGLLSQEALQACDILYISYSEKHRVNKIIAEIEGLPVLTVSDIEGFSHLGGMITLVTIEQKIRFQINRLALERAGLTISSKILELAEIVNDRTFNIEP
jgi:YfiR/HmsC-like